MKFSIGADPEVFFQNDNGKLISVINRIGGDKLNPKPFGNGFGILEDNVAAEFNIPPSETEEGWKQNLSFAMEYLKTVAKDQGLALSLRASASFDMDQLNDPMAFVFGCEPDYNAWTGKRNKRPHSEDITLRSCGGHVHVGFPFTSREDQQAVIKLMDLTLGVPSVRMDTDTKRRELYGKHGSFRYKPYGAEYRTLSNFWVLNPDLHAWVYQQTKKAIELFSENFSINDEHEAIAECIDKNNGAAYDYLMGKYGDLIG